MSLNNITTLKGVRVMQKASMTTNRAKPVKNANITFLLKGRSSGKVLAQKAYIDKFKKENPNIKIVIIRVSDLKMKNRDFKMRERWEQKEYYPDKNGETRLERINNRKWIKEVEKEKAEWLKQRGEDNG